MKKEKPTREERLNAYEFAREWLNNNLEDCQTGICTLIREATYPSRLTIYDFPEFIEAKPKDKDVGGYWFSSAKERIQVLTKIINKMKEEKRINLELPSDCEAKFDEENNVLIIYKKEEGIYIPDSTSEVKGKKWLSRTIYSSNPYRSNAFGALSELVEMRDAANGDWIADWKDGNQDTWIIGFISDINESPHIAKMNNIKAVLSFKSEEIAQAFLDKHIELIKKAKELL